MLRAIVTVFVLLVSSKYQVVNGDVILYGVGSTNLFTIDTSTGATTVIGAHGIGGGGLDGLAYDSSTDTLYAIDDSGTDNLYTIDRLTGTATLVGATVNTATPNDLAFDSSTNSLYATDSLRDALFVINKATGLAAIIGDPGFHAPAGVAYDANADILYGYDNFSTTLFHFNRTNGSASQQVSVTPVGIDFSTLAFDQSTNTLYGAAIGPGTLYSINTLTGTSTSLGQIGGGETVGGMAFVSTVPEPSTFGLMGLGAFLLMCARGKRARFAVVASAPSLC